MMNRMENTDRFFLRCCRCNNCGRFVSYHAITKDHDGCFECDPNATLERQAEIRRCIA